ncbi:MAG: NADH-quinone oxidoreductase subunit C [Acidobacteria bacterium]|nr:NADH-quinone oxidoreductase subunit C [Acidobacteriota bacterium]
MAVETWESALTGRLAARFGGGISRFGSYLGQPFLEARADLTLDVLRFLRDEEAFDFLVDLTAVDRPGHAERFELVYILYSFASNERIRVKTRVGDGVAAPSVTGVYPAADWLEREVFDMFGIGFAGHPKLRRILLPDDWSGHPLRRETSILAMDQDWVRRNLGIESGQ